MGQGNQVFNYLFFKNSTLLALFLLFQISLFFGPTPVSEIPWEVCCRRRMELSLDSPRAECSENLGVHIRLMSCHLKEWLILVGIWRYTDPICAVTRNSGLQGDLQDAEFLIRFCPFFLVDLDRAEELCLGKWGVQVGQTFPYSVVPHCPKLHWQEFVPMGQSWEEERLNAPATQAHSAFRSSPGDNFSLLLLREWCTEEWCKIILWKPFVNPLQSSWIARDHFLTQKLLCLPQCTSVWDLFLMRNGDESLCRMGVVHCWGSQSGLMVQTGGSPYVLNGKVLQVEEAQS